MNPIHRIYKRYQQAIDAAAQETGLHPYLIAAVIYHESGGNPTARSSAGALGLMQLMPATARALKVRDPFDPEENIRAGARYLKLQLDRFGQIPFALAAYNAGPGRVRQYNGIPPIPETQRYVHKIMALLERHAPEALQPARLPKPIGIPEPDPTERAEWDLIRRTFERIARQAEQELWQPEPLPSLENALPPFPSFEPWSPEREAFPIETLERASLEPDPPDPFLP